MPNIVLSRIDERLIHGQVGVQWVGFAGANLVLVDDMFHVKKVLVGGKVWQQEQRKKNV